MRTRVVKTTLVHLSKQKNMDNLSPKMEKRYNMIVSNLRKAKSEKDTDRIYSNHIVLLPKKVKNIICDRLINIGLAEKSDDNIYLLYDDGL